MECGSDRCMGTDGYDPKKLYFYEALESINMDDSMKNCFSENITPI